MNKFKHLLLAALLLTSQLLSAQFSVTFKPNATVGQDATPIRNDVCTSYQTNTSGAATDMSTLAWTWNTVNCGPGVGRSIVRFDELSTLPAGAVITYAELRLFGVATSGYYQGNSYYTGSPYNGYGNNSAWIRRVTAPWVENTITWNTQPTFTTVDQVAVPASTTQWNYNVALNVTSMVSAMMAPGANNGFLLMLQNENYYRCVIFATSDHPDAARWPELYIKYEIPCNAKFTYCVSSQNPGTYDFKVDNPQLGYTYTWNFGDGTTGVGAAVSHNYALGTYKVCLNAYNQSTGATCQQCVNFCVQNNSLPDTCSAKFSFEKITPSLVQFYGQAFGPNPVASVVWDFGDGTTSTAWPNVQHQYAQSGTYAVCVKVKYQNGCEVKYCYQVEIVIAITCDVSFTKSGFRLALTFTGVGQSGLTVASALWDFGDGTTSTAWPSVRHGYTAVGYYTVCLRVTYTNGCTATYCQQVYVGEAILQIEEPQSLSSKSTHTTKSIEVIPNPINNSLVNVKLTIEEGGMYGYTLFDAQGKALHTGTKLLNKGMQTVQVLAKDLKPGNYWVAFTHNKKQIRAGFVRL